jgi:hypothetical protein
MVEKTMAFRPRYPRSNGWTRARPGGARLILVILALGTCVRCFEQESRVIKTSVRRSKASTPPMPVAGSVTVERSGRLELCIDARLAPVSADKVPNARKLLGERLANATGGEAGAMVDKSCAERFRLRADLATCTLDETVQQDGGSLGLTLTKHHHLVSACDPGSVAERNCRAAHGTWQVADPSEPGVAAERFRQSATHTLRAVDHNLLKEVDRATSPR